MSIFDPQPPATHNAGGTSGNVRPRTISVGTIPRPTAPVRSTAVVRSTAAPQSLGNGVGRSQGSSHILANGTVLQQRYLIESVLGTGGMSVVYRGRDLHFKEVARYCAIKEMFQVAPDSATRTLRLQHFEREAGLLATLSHPAIPKVYDFFEEQGHAYVIMELVPGTDLEALLHERGEPFDEVTVGGWALQLCDVLTYLHTASPEPIIFRDLKPSNIMVTPDDRVMLIDFGIARVFEQQASKGTLIGTEGYAPPEQYRGVIDVRGDLYALGATLHHLLTNTDPRNEPPFTFDERPLRLLNPRTTPEMQAILAHTLQYDLEQRPEHSAALKEQLLRLPSLSHLHNNRHAFPRSPHTPGSINTAAKLVWRMETGDEVRSSPHVRNDLVFIGSYDKHIYALDAATGGQRWRRATLGGVSSSPTTAHHLVVVGSEDGSIYALDSRSGVPRWSIRTDRAIRSSPRVMDRLVYVGSDDQHVYAIDTLSGRIVWKYRTWMPVRSSCAIKDDLLAVGSSDGHVYGLDAATGGLRWKHRTSQGVISSPVIEQGLVIVGSMDQNVYAIDAEGGSPVWRYRTEHYVNASPCVVDGRVYIGGIDGNLYTLELKSGRLVWKYASGCQISSSARVEGDKLYIGATDGNIICLNSADGTVVWHYRTNGPVVSSPAVANGMVYVGSLDRHVYALEA